MQLALGSVLSCAFNLQAFDFKGLESFLESADGPVVTRCLFFGRGRGFIWKLSRLGILVLVVLAVVGSSLSAVPPPTFQPARLPPIILCLFPPSSSNEEGGGPWTAAAPDGPQP